MTGRHRDGFTLIEMLVAIAIAAVGILTVFEIFPMGFAATRKSESRVRAMAVAVYHLTDFQHGLNDFHFGETTSKDDQGNSYYPDYKSPYLSYVAVDQNSGDGGSDSGAPLATAQDWAQDSQDNTYYWRATMSEVLDPAQKYRPMLLSTYTRQFADLLRVTVYVRGPFSASYGINTYQSNGRVLAPDSSVSVNATGVVEVRLSTYVANRRLGYTEVVSAADPPAAYPANGIPSYPTPDPDANSGQTWINVSPTFGNGLDGFTVFNSDCFTGGGTTTNPFHEPANTMLSPIELVDTGSILASGLPIYDSNGTQTGTTTTGGTKNQYGLDNVIISDSNISGHTDVETNKVIQIENDPVNGNYRLWLLYPLQHTYPTDSLVRSLITMPVPPS